MIVTVLSTSGEKLGQALFNPRSKIALRLMTRGETTLEASLVVDRVMQAVAYRARICPEVQGHRVVHSEADGVPGLTVDRYAEVLVLQCHAAALEPFLPDVIEALQASYAPTGILARHDSPVRALEGLPQEVAVLAGRVPERVAFREGDVTLYAAPYTGQKTGAFLDQRENHVYAGRIASGRALDVCSYHGGFALQLAAHADEVTALDSSEAALEHLGRAARANALAVQTVRGDAFELLRGLAARGERFDTVVLDPPAFAKGRQHLEAALKGYHDLNLHALSLLGVGGTLMSASCSHVVTDEMFRDMLTGAARDARRQVRVLARRGAASCHPEVLALPESRYLSFVALEVTEVWGA